MDFDRWDELMHGAVIAGEVTTTEESADGLSAWQRYRALAGLSKGEPTVATRTYKVKAPTDVLRRAPEVVD